MRTMTAVLLCGLVLSASMAGCGKKTVTRSNYDKVSTGMTSSEVIQILGEPDERTSAGATVGEAVGSTATMVWKDGDKSITVVFVNDKVMTKAQQNL